jgi:glutathione S-transferase
LIQFLNRSLSRSPCVAAPDLPRHVIYRPIISMRSAGSDAPAPLSWEALESLVAPVVARREPPETGPTSAQALLRSFGAPEAAIRVTLHRDHHAWCPYCQKVWLWLEEARIPYRIRKVAMACYGEKELWYRSLVPNGMLPALILDGRLITESDRILAELEAAFGPIGVSLGDPRALPLRQLERLLFRAWCEWLCRPSPLPGGDERARQAFERQAAAMAAALEAQGGPFLFGTELSGVDLVFVPFLERMSASLAYYKGYLLRQRFAPIERWFAALERRSTYLGTQSDFHTHTHDLPPQMGGCSASGTEAQRRLAARIDAGPWPILEAAGGPDPETSAPEPADAALLALARVLRHRPPLLARSPLGAAGFDLPLRCALSLLATGAPCPPPAGSAAALRQLRDRICVPRDMPLHAARRLRQALERTACLDPLTPEAQGPAIPRRDRFDQDPSPFLAAAGVSGCPA